MKGEITISTTKNKRTRNKQEPFLFDPLDSRIVYAYKMSATKLMAMNIGGEEINLAYNKDIWDALERRFCPPTVQMGYEVNALNQRT